MASRTKTCAVVTTLVLGGIGSARARADELPGWHLPVETRTLSNGLTVVVSEDHTSPTFGLSIVFRVGFRLEPRGRTGFAHLFEHMMFQGTPNAPKGTYDRVIEGGGGINNGSTRPDYTNYIVSAPVSALDAVLWLEADRMRGLDFSPANLANQQEVVKEEIRVNVKNRPYGLFFWTDLSALAFDRWENAHDGYGAFEDLEAASLVDVRSFFETYYAPNNAVLAVVGDVSPEEVFAAVESRFGPIPARPVPAPPDVSEPLNTAERTLEQADPLARVPALAVGWKAPARDTPDHAPAAVLAELLVGGEASRLYQGLVKGRELMLDVNGGLHWPLGDAWTYGGPTLFTVFGLYKPDTDAATVAGAVQEEVERVARDGVPEAELRRVRTKLLSTFYSSLELYVDRADALAITQALGGSAAALGDVPARVAAVTSDDVRRVAATYLTVANRSRVDRRPAPAAAEGAPAEGGR